MNGTAGVPLRLGVVATHPIQYQVPLFRALSEDGRFECRVFYAVLPSEEQQGIGFGRAFSWDIPLLDGYPWETAGAAFGDAALSRFTGLYAKGLARALRDFSPDVVLITGWNSWFLLQALWIAKRLGYPALVRGDSNDIPRRVPWKGWLQRALFMGFDGFLYVGEANKRLYLQAGIPAKRLYSCPHVIDNQRLRRESETLRAGRTAIRAAFGMEDGMFCFLFVGKLESKKRVLDFLEGLRRVQAEGSGVYGLVVGSGALDSEARNVAIRHGLSVHFAGFLNQREVVSAYVAADCLVLPSDAGETWGLVVNEAMACGLPVIVSDQVGCGEDLVIGGATGERYPCGDAPALAATMRVMAADRDRAQTLGAQAQARVLDAYSIEAAVDGIANAARGILNERRHQGNGA